MTEPRHCGCPAAPPLTAFQYEPTGGRVWVRDPARFRPHAGAPMAYAASESDVRRAVLGFAPSHDVRDAAGRMLRQGRCQGE